LPRLLHRPAVAVVVDMAAAADTVVGLAAAAFVAAGLGAAVDSAVLQSAVSAVARSAVSAAGLVDSVGPHWVAVSAELDLAASAVQ
jgi:hypothetical protein